MIFHRINSLLAASLLVGLLTDAAIAAQTVSGVGASTGGISPTAGGKVQAPGTLPPGGVKIDDPQGGPNGDGTGMNPNLIPGAAGKVLGRTVVGYFNDDEWLDTIVLVDGEPIVLSGRDLYLSFDKPWNSGILSLDAYTGAGPSGQDAVILTDAAGLHFAWWDFTDKKFKTQLIDSNAWAGATHVRVADVDGAARIDVVGISADGKQLLVIGASSESPPVFTPLTGFATDSAVLSFTVLEWDGSGLPEIALLTEDALEVRSFGGALEQQWAGLPGGGWLATIRQGYLPNDRLTWVTPGIINPVTQLLVQTVFTVDKDAIDLAVDASGTLVTSVVGADWDGDGDDDLLVGYGITHDLVVLINERSAAAPTAMSFTSASMAYMLPIGPTDTQNAGQLANVVVGDYDNDGDVDAALAVASSGEFRIGKNDASIYSGDVPIVSRLRYIVTQGSPTGDLKIRVERPLVVNGLKTELQVVQWRQDRINGASDPTPVAVDNFTIVRWPNEVTVQIEEPGQYFTSIYYLELRFGDRNSETQSTDYRSASMGGFTLSPSTIFELAKIEGSGQPLLFVPEGELIFNPGEVGSLGGGYIPELRVPPTTGLNYN